MNYHKSIKPLHDKIAKLTFTTNHLKAKLSPDDELDCDFIVTKYTACNGLSLPNFRADLEHVFATIQEAEKSKLVDIGSHYKKELLETIISLDLMKSDYFGDKYKGLVLELPEVTPEEDPMYLFGLMNHPKDPIDAREAKEEFYKVIFDGIDTLKANLSALLFGENEDGVASTGRKLKWKAKPAVVSYLMLQLFEAGWIDPELRNNDANREELAKVMSESFLFDGTDSKSVKTIRNYFTPTLLNQLKANKPEINKLSIPSVNTLG